jgi:RIO-like serine/threonine protein kinase
MITFDNIKITNKILGIGMNGTVYLAKDSNNNKYALKIQKIFPKEVKKDLSQRLWREIYFADNLSRKYPDQFYAIV